MGKKIIVQLQGGAALGAFQAGAWQALAPFVRRDGHQLVAVAGASIGALNAAMIARHAHAYDGGRAELLSLWRRDLATAPLPFFALPGEYWRAWNGLLTGLLMGNRGIHSPLYMNWNPFGEMARSIAPLYENRNAEVTVGRRIGEYAGASPRLIIGASDVKSGDLALFDSARQPITGRHIRASTAIPNLVSPIEIDGRYYWDGDLRGNSLLDDVLPLLREQTVDEDEEWLVVAVDMFSPTANSCR